MHCEAMGLWCGLRRARASHLCRSSAAAGPCVYLGAQGSEVENENTVFVAKAQLGIASGCEDLVASEYQRCLVFYQLVEYHVHASSGPVLRSSLCGAASSYL
jgi:hypothetical protein